MPRPAPQCGPGRGILTGPRKIRGPGRPGANASPDLAYVVSALSKFNSCPITAHYSAMGRVLRYLETTKNMGILYTGEPNLTSAISELACYTDSDWGGDRDKRRSTGGFVLTLCGGAVSWKTRKQDIVALSTTEAEYKIGRAHV